jgi:hypothetical protein
VAWNNENEIVVAGNGQVYVAPTGTALPTTTIGALNAAFVGLGYLTEDGATITVTPEIAEFMAWQSRTPVRREKTSQQVQVAFSLMQWDEDSVPLAFGGGSVSGSAGNYRYDLPADDSALDERAMVLDWNDGTEHWRFVMARGNVVEAVEAQLRRSDPSVLPITFRGLVSSGQTPGYYLTDSTAFAAGS